MTDLQRELEIARWLADAIDEHKKPLHKWGLGEVPVAGIMLGIRSLAEAERHNAEVERLLRELVSQDA